MTPGSMTSWLLMKPWSKKTWHCATLKLTQEAVSDLERVKGELQGAAARKDKEGSALAAKIDDEATLGAKYAKQAKELQARLEELDEELAVERGNRSKAEKSRTMLKKDIE